MSDAASEGEGRLVHPWVADGERVVRIGVAYGPTITGHLDWPALLAFVLACEEAGIDSFWVPDHPTSFPDPWVTLSALAATSASWVTIKSDVPWVRPRSMSKSSTAAPVA